jgi:hypothetical protein
MVWVLVLFCFTNEKKWIFFFRDVIILLVLSFCYFEMRFCNHLAYYVLLCSSSRFLMILTYYYRKKPSLLFPLIIQLNVYPCLLLFYLWEIETLLFAAFTFFHVEILIHDGEIQKKMGIDRLIWKVKILRKWSSIDM